MGLFLLSTPLGRVVIEEEATVREGMLRYLHYHDILHSRENTAADSREGGERSEREREEGWR